MSNQVDKFKQLAAKTAAMKGIDVTEVTREKTKDVIKKDIKKAKKSAKKVAEAAITEIKDTFTEGEKKNWEKQQIDKITAERLASQTPAEKIDAYLKAHNLFIVDEWVPCSPAFIAFVEESGFKKGYQTATKEQQNNNEKEDVEMNAEQMKSLLNEVLDVREGNRRAEEIEIAKLRIEQLKLEIELEKAKAAAKSVVPEFELQPFMPTNNVEARATELGIDLEEQKRMSKMVQDFVYVSDEEPVKKPVKKAVVKKIVEGKVEEVLEDGPSTPIRFKDGQVSISWKKVIKQDKFLETLIPIVQYAKDELNIDVSKSSTFKKTNSMFNGAYQQFVIQYKGQGRGVWTDFIQFKIK